MSEILFYDSTNKEYVVPVDRIKATHYRGESRVVLYYRDEPIFAEFLPMIEHVNLLAMNRYDGRIFPCGHYDGADDGEFANILPTTWQKWTEYVFGKLVKEGAFDTAHRVDPAHSLTVKYDWRGGKITKPPLSYKDGREQTKPADFDGLDFFDKL